MHLLHLHPAQHRLRNHATPRSGQLWPILGGCLGRLCWWVLPHRGPLRLRNHRRTSTRRRGLSNTHWHQAPGPQLRHPPRTASDRRQSATLGHPVLRTQMQHRIVHPPRGGPAQRPGHQCATGSRVPHIKPRPSSSSRSIAHAPSRCSSTTPSDQRRGITNTSRAKRRSTAVSHTPTPSVRLWCYFGSSSPGTSSHAQRTPSKPPSPLLATGTVCGSQDRRGIPPRTSIHLRQCSSLWQKDPQQDDPSRRSIARHAGIHPRPIYQKIPAQRLTSYADMLPPDSQQTNHSGTSSAGSEQILVSPSSIAQTNQDSTQSDQCERTEIPATQPENNPPTDPISQSEKSTSTTPTITIQRC